MGDPKTPALKSFFKSYILFKMFESIKLLGSSERRIELQTRRPTSIPNSQAPDPDEPSIRGFNQLCRKHSDWILRKPPCGVYNCAGFVWASRRTSIYEEEYFWIILDDDGYRKLANEGAVKLGDLAVYTYRETGSFLHVGVVTKLKGFITASRQTPPTSQVPWILSKWNDATGEVLHHYRDVPWDDDQYEVSFWTDR